MPELVEVTPSGATCAAGDFTVDPLLPVARAVITHGHADHARPGSGEYWCTVGSEPILRKRLPDAVLHAIPYAEPFDLGATRVSFHPAGHVLGSAQVRVEAQEVWVLSGDYKRAADPTCAPFEPVPCDVFVTEATFGLPIFRWEPPEHTIARILAWWDENRAAGRASVLLGYGLGKAQRILAELAKVSDRTAWVHGALAELIRIYREAGVRMLDTTLVAEQKERRDWAGELVLAPPGWEATPWIRRFGADARVGFASGWMAVRGNRRRRGVDRGFALSDHADWPGLLQTIADSGAKRILVTHGAVDPLARWLREHGVDASPWRVGWEVEERPDRADA
jgi:putative mRNA 3-end processing factor